MKPKLNKRWLPLSICFSLAIGSILYFFLRTPSKDQMAQSRPLSKENRYFIPIKIQGFSPGNIPFFSVNIENETVLAKIDLGYQGYMALPSPIIHKLHSKKFIQRSSNYGLNGKTQESNMYELG